MNLNGSFADAIMNIPLVKNYDGSHGLESRCNLAFAAAAHDHEEEMHPQTIQLLAPCFKGFSEAIVQGLYNDESKHPAIRMVHYVFADAPKVADTIFSVSQATTDSGLAPVISSLMNIIKRDNKNYGKGDHKDLIKFIDFFAELTQGSVDQLKKHYSVIPPTIVNVLSSIIGERIMISESFCGITPKDREDISKTAENTTRLILEFGEPAAHTLYEYSYGSGSLFTSIDNLVSDIENLKGIMGNVGKNDERITLAVLKTAAAIYSDDSYFRGEEDESRQKPLRDIGRLFSASPSLATAVAQTMRYPLGINLEKYNPYAFQHISKYVQELFPILSLDLEGGLQTPLAESVEGSWGLYFTDGGKALNWSLGEYIAFVTSMVAYIEPDTAGMTNHIVQLIKRGCEYDEAFLIRTPVLKYIVGQIADYYDYYGEFIKPGNKPSFAAIPGKIIKPGNKPSFAAIPHLDHPSVYELCDAVHSNLKARIREDYELKYSDVVSNLVRGDPEHIVSKATQALDLVRNGEKIDHLFK